MCKMSPAFYRICSHKIRLQHIQAPSFAFHLNNRIRRERPSRPYTAGTMNPNELAKSAEAVGLGMWSAVTSQDTSYPRPASVHHGGFSFCMPEGHNSLAAWDTSTFQIQSTQDIMPQTYSVQQDFFNPTGSENSMIGSIRLAHRTLICHRWVDCQNI